MSKDSKTLYAPFSSKIILLEDVKKVLKNQLLIAGMIPKDFIRKEGKIFDLSLSEELMILNAIPTVEGILKIAIEETDITLHEANVMVFGYGRIGKILCNRLKALGANVYCVVKEKKDATWLREKRYSPILYEEIEKEKIYQQIDIIINTAPSLVLQENILKKLRQNCFILDVASSHGGVDKDAAKRYKLKVITALGIPGKIAPKTTAQYIKNIIQEKIEM